MQKPEGIIDETNLYNHVYGQFTPLAWSDPDFQTKLKWIKDLTQCEYASWYAPVNISPGVPNTILSTMVRAVMPNGEGFDFDVLNLNLNPELVVYTLFKISGHPKDLIQYPGYDALNPKTSDSPIGDKFDDSRWPGRALFHVAMPQGEKYGIGEKYEDAKATYILRRIVITPGNIFTGQGGTNQIVWEKVYSRE